MPPKKKKPTPLVVGTVSTRSTRRQSVVNMEISSKVNKPPKSPSPKKPPKMRFKGLKIDENEFSQTPVPDPAPPGILELLRDWSDDDNSQNVDISLQKLNDDHQSLIDILEGKQVESEVQGVAEHLKKICIENPLIHVDSPLVNEPDIIEECVVEDNNVMIISEEPITTTNEDFKETIYEIDINTSQLQNENVVKIENSFEMESIKIEPLESNNFSENSSHFSCKSEPMDSDYPLNNPPNGVNGNEIICQNNHSENHEESKEMEHSNDSKILEDEIDSTSSESVQSQNSNKGPKLKKSSSEDSKENISSNHIDDAIDEVIKRFSSDNFVWSTVVAKPKSTPKKKTNKGKKDFGELNEEVRRSDRIRTIPLRKKKSHGLVKVKSEPNLEAENSDSNSIDKLSPLASPQLTPAKLEKSKSTKSKSLENLPENLTTQSPLPELPKAIDMNNDKSGQAEVEARLKSFAHIKDNIYKTDRQTCKEAREMTCDCFLAEEDVQNGEYGCGDDCLNRLLMIECSELCQVGYRCTNKRFQKGNFAPVEVFKTEKKGLGLRAAANIPYGEFILEYVGEVLDPDEFDKRTENYSKDKNTHFYFMSLRADAIIDATIKGNISRFINHSCEPNAETQKWTVNGELRIGFFSTRTILAGEEITFDYRFQRYGKEAQRCFCDAQTCRGWLGEQPGESEDEEEEDDDEDAEKSLSASIIKDIKEEEKDGVKPELEKAEPEVVSQDATSTQDVTETPKKTSRRRPRKEVLFEDFDQLIEDIEMLLTTGLKNQAHTLKLSRLMVRAKDLEQRKKLLRVLRRGELPCRRLFLDYHGLRLMHGYMIDAQQLQVSSQLEMIQTKLELLQTLAVLPIQNKTMLIESKVLPTVEKWAKNEDIKEETEQGLDKPSQINSGDAEQPEVKEKIDEIKFLAAKLLEEWGNLKESFKIPKKQRIEQMKEHEKEANRKFLESSYAQEKDSSRKNDQRYRTWSRYKSERENTKRTFRPEDKDRPSAEFLKISKHERRKLFALQIELKEEERRMKQRELWRQHEMNCMMIGADPRFTAPFDPSKGFQYIWNPSLGQWQALPVPAQYNSTAPQAVPKQPLISPFPTVMNVQGMPAPQYPGMPGMVPRLGNPFQNPVHTVPGIPGIPPPMFQELKSEDPTQVKFAGPIPPPVKLPSKWKCAKDKYGRPYYYHVTIRKSQWEPPPFPEPLDESSETSSSDTSSLSSTDPSSDSETDDEIDDNKLLLEVRKQMESASKIVLKSAPDKLKKESELVTPSPESKPESEDSLNSTVTEQTKSESSIDVRLKQQFHVDGNESGKKKKRPGLCQEIIISPRTEEDRLQSKEDLKRYKATKERLKRQKAQLVFQPKKKLKVCSASNDDNSGKRPKPSVKARIKEMKEWNDEHSRKIKESFRSTMATTVVGALNAYRKPDCKEGRIINTEDFKHLARKLTHFVMLKELKHLSSIEELVCTDNVKAKAREFIKKYMSKFGEVYQKRQDEPDFKD
ncbi:hypothetical protein ABEB36_013156 [Hypothenemus hampei]|uniref:[histone H3]-lysine(36) N-trimethyltransferase n=1 Tax=Hypothenemus hampei TaxID=57062 RepID=A0ABD1E7C3_HYPHA